MAAVLQKNEDSYKIITPYDAQRTLIENRLKSAHLVWQNKCFNVDSFQGLHFSCLLCLLFYLANLIFYHRK